MIGGLAKLASDMVPSAAQPNQLTNTAGIPVNENKVSKTAGPLGPVVVEDFHLFQKNAMFNRERIPERVVHAKGTGAFGTFTVTHDISKYTKAKVFAGVGHKTDLVVRFSSAVAERGYTDLGRDMRGFAIKFYTPDGNWDLTANHFAAFFINDGKRFPDLMHALKREPRSNLKSETTKWDFWTQNPESLHTVTMLFSDRGIPLGFPYMDGFSQNTYSFINLANERFWVRFTLKTQQGVKCLTQQEANRLSGDDPDYHSRQLFEMIENKQYPKWKMFVQIMPERGALDAQFNPFDPSKVWPHGDFPLIEVGTLELNKNPENFFTDIEQLAFQPSNLVPGISVSPDRVLQARLFAYGDAQRYRMGVNYERLPVNAPHHAHVVNTYTPDGLMRFDDNGRYGPNYAPNTMGGPEHNPKMSDPPVNLPVEPAAHYDPVKVKEEDYTQPGNLYRLLTPDKREILHYNVAESLKQVSADLQKKAISWIARADPQYAEGVEKTLQKQMEIDRRQKAEAK